MLSITEQIEDAKKLILSKLPVSKRQFMEGGQPLEQYIAYFQAYTNTYGKLETLRKIFFEAILHEEVVGLSIATRPDCLDQEILTLLAELNAIKPVWIELGLQTCHEETARFIRRGYSLPVFEDAVKNLRALSLQVIVHLILGLPGETKKEVLQSVSYVASQQVNGIKLQLLHVLEDTDLAHFSFPILAKEEYIDLVISCLEIIPDDIVIHRVTGDGPKNLLIAPKWSGNKKLVLNDLHKTLKQRDTWQGRKLNYDPK
jgi:radical SAM protein (TIGR01212 family)